MVMVVVVLPLQTSMPESVFYRVCDCSGSIPKSMMNAFVTTPTTIPRWMARLIQARIHAD